MLLSLDERFRINSGQFAQRAQEVGRREKPDRRLQVRTVKLLAKLAAELTVHTDIYVSVGEASDVVYVRAEREGEIDFAADAFDQATDFREVRRHVERAVDGTDDVDARLLAFLAR